MRFYFDHVYNPVYDFIVSQSAPYHQLQQNCIDKLELKEGDALLCAGIGTGNEAIKILQDYPNIKITGIDTSINALRKIQRKAQKHNLRLETKLMDIQALDFPDKSFDKVLCVHVMDFVPDTQKAAAELMRVLKDNGKFAVTFPSGKEDFRFGMQVIGSAIKHDWHNKQYLKIPIFFLSTIVAAFIYLPFLFRKERRFYSRLDVEAIFQRLTMKQLHIEDFQLYNDFIVHGVR